VVDRYLGRKKRQLFAVLSVAISGLHLNLADFVPSAINFVFYMIDTE
jgi:hypothetical protein